MHGFPGYGERKRRDFQRKKESTKKVVLYGFDRKKGPEVFAVYERKILAYNGITRRKRRMKKVKLLVDSTCDLPLNLLKANDVDIIPLMVNFNEEGYEDLVELSTADLYRKVEEKGILPKTAARSIEKFKEVYQKFFDQGYEEIVFIGISGYFSSTIQNALTAGNEFPGRVFVHDSLNLSSGEGLQILKAIEMIKEGLEGKEILSRLQEIAPRVRSQFAVESLEYLYKGGRCSQTSYYFGKGFKIKPIIRVVDGKMIVYKKPIGKMENALNKMVEILKSDWGNVDLGTVMITHSMADSSAEYLHRKLKDFVPEDKIMITDAGCVISSHCGKGTIGILYILKP